MVSHYSSADAAAEIGIAPRVLRRFIRNNPSWKNATHAGRYSFTESEMKSLKLQFEKSSIGKSHRRSQHGVVENEITELDQDPGIAVEDLERMKTDPFFRREVKERREARQARLRERINQLGLNNRIMEDA